jgi:hypothetical protein
VKSLASQTRTKEDCWQNCRAVIVSSATKEAMDQLPVDCFEAIAKYVSKSELMLLCLVSKHFSDVFTPILYRHVFFDYPNVKRFRPTLEDVQTPKFRNNMVSLELTFVARDKANCSWPIAMKKCVYHLKQSHLFLFRCLIDGSGTG